MGKLVDLSGKKFGKLTVMCRVSNSNTQPRWKCKCECGKEKDIQGAHLKNGHTQSCGCSWYRYGETHISWRGHKEISSRFFSSIRHGAKIRKLEFSITIEEIWDLFLKQNRKCALSGIPLIFGANHGKIVGNASLDRIDSNKGYITNNIQWVDVNINCMKWDMPQEKFLILCNTISNYQQTSGNI